MNHLKISLGIILVLAASRFIPHPPNFTSVLALSFYVPILFGRKYLTVLLLGFVLTDIVIGFHQLLFFTWGSVLLIGCIAKIFKNNFKLRILGNLVGAILFFLLTNFGVWLTGNYEFSYEGLKLCYVLAIPFFTNTIISTIIYGLVIEVLYSIYKRYIFA